jgi:phage shock protein PspC (stress-responsive transcriptional regulator)
MTRLYRSTRDKKIFGLCGGLAEAFNVDATLLRLVVVVATFFSAGTVILLYILCSLVIPKEPEPPYGKFGGPYGGTYGGPYGGSFGGSTYSAGGHYGHTGNHDMHSTYAGQAKGHAYSGTGPSTAAPGRQAEAPNVSHNLDEMMKDVEVKALRKEIEELRAKLAKLEKGEE